MAKQVNYTHSNGTAYPESYWRITQLVVDVPNLYAKFVFTGYKDEAARLAGKEPIGEKTIHLTGETFATYFAEVTGKVKNPQEVGYEYCTEYKDTTKTVTTIVEGEEVSEVVPASFFEEAEDV